MSHSDFAEALRKGMQLECDLRDELEPFEDYSITTADAHVLCEMLKLLPRPEDYAESVFFSPLSKLLGYFQSAAQEDLPACKVLYEHGIPELVRIFDEMSVKPDVYAESDDMLLILKMCAWYQHPLGSELLLKAALIPFKSDGFLWHTTFYTLAKDHPHRDRIFEALSEKLPTGFLCVSFLDSANRAMTESDLQQHPFDSPEGYSRLEGYLTNRDPSEFSYAVSASAALSYLSEPARTQLMALAMDHVDKSIQLQAAVSAVRLGSEAGLRVLIRFAEDVNYSIEAVAKLIELEKEEYIPAVALENRFHARAEFAHWLRHPNELGRPPTQVEIVDYRELEWPPTGDRRPMYVIKYRMLEEGGCELDNADVDCGLVGSLTFCLFSSNNHQRPPEDVYAIHCAWELEIQELVKRESVDEDYSKALVLPRYNGQLIEEAEACYVFHIADSVGYPGKEVVLVCGKVGPDAGWFVVDGERSAWYPDAEQPGESRGDVVGKLHIGRVLLGFNEYVDRRSFFESTQGPSPELVVRVYEELLDKARSDNLEEQTKLLTGMGPLDKHFRAYVRAKEQVEQISADVAFVEAFEMHFVLCEQASPSLIPQLFYRYSVVPSQLEAYIKSKRLVAGVSEESVVVETFERFMAVLQRAEHPRETKLLDTFGILADKFEWFMDAYIASGKQDRVSQLIRYLGQYWDKPITDCMLGKVACKIGDDDLAELHLVKLLDRKKIQLRMPELSLLAEIWHRQGKVDESSDLLVTCIENLTREIATCKYRVDLNRFKEEREQHVEVYSRLFPEKAGLLPKLVLPAHPLA